MVWYPSSTLALSLSCIPGTDTSYSDSEPQLLPNLNLTVSSQVRIISRLHRGYLNIMQCASTVSYETRPNNGGCKRSVVYLHVVNNVIT